MPWIDRKEVYNCPICKKMLGYWVGPWTVEVQERIFYDVKETTWIVCSVCSGTGQVMWYERHWVPPGETNRDEN